MGSLGDPKVVHPPQGVHPNPSSRPVDRPYHSKEVDGNRYIVISFDQSLLASHPLITHSTPMPQTLCVRGLGAHRGIHVLGCIRPHGASLPGKFPDATLLLAFMCALGLLNSECLLCLIASVPFL